MWMLFCAKSINISITVILFCTTATKLVNNLKFEVKKRASQITDWYLNDLQYLQVQC